nr:MAG TPA: hypothetical protein [Caudoviricetes sp.]
MSNFFWCPNSFLRHSFTSFNFKFAVNDAPYFRFLLLHFE